MNPIVSVIVPVYMIEQYIDQCITSIRKQSYRYLDILIIIDGSPDNSLAICNRHASVDKRITIVNQENKGLSAARNIGLQKSKGEYITFVDGDDWIDPNMIERMVDEIQHSRAQVCCCGHIREADSQALVFAPQYAILDGKTAAIEWLRNREIKMMAWAKLYSKSLFCEYDFFPEGRWYEDTAACWKAFVRSEQVLVIPDCLYHYRIREGSITHMHRPKNVVDKWYAFHSLYEGLKNLDAELERQSLRMCVSCIEYSLHERFSFSKEELSLMEPTYESIASFSRTHLWDCLRIKSNLLEKTCVILAAMNSRFSVFLYRIIYGFYSIAKKIILLFMKKRRPSA